MPYIEKKYREQIDAQVDALAKAVNLVYHTEKEAAKKEGRERFQTRDGLMNYAITRILNQIYPEANYHEFNEAIGMLKCCGDEYYRQYVAPYEVLKSKQNGEVPTYTKKDLEKILKEALSKKLESVVENLPTNDVEVKTASTEKVKATTKTTKTSKSNKKKKK